MHRLTHPANLKMMKAIPATEKLFEKKVDVKRIDIFNLNVEGIKDHLTSLPKEKQLEIISIADKAMEGIITGFSSIELDYGNPINWHYSPLTKVKTDPSVKWYCIPDFEGKQGDIKVVWEASRLTHFYYFTRAYLITGDRKYYEGFSVQLEQWLKANPYPYGANFKCGQECTLRMINALMAYTIFNHYGLIKTSDESNLATLVEVCYKKVLANFFYAHKCIKNNHTFSEITGLIIGAWCCKEKDRLAKAYALLDQQVQKQFLPDGGYIQYSFNYQRFTLQLMECIFKLSEKTGIYFSESAKTRMKNSALLMYQMQDEKGDLPNYGSNDGALIFPVTACGYRDFRPALNTIYALIEGKRLYEPGIYDEELLWFGSGQLDVLPLAGIKKEPLSFQDSGFYSLHHNEGFLMIVLQDYNTRPGQMDQLHIDLWHQGRNVFCDSGTFSYAASIGRNMALTSAHNTAKINGREQMNKHGPFLIYDWTRAKDAKHDKGTFSGTMVSKNGYQHTRNINRTSYGYIIRDQVKGPGEYCEFYFHVPYMVKLIPAGFKILDKDTVLCVVMVDGGDIEVRKAYRSLYYLQLEEINCVAVRSSLRDQKCSVTFKIRLVN